MAAIWAGPAALALTMFALIAPAFFLPAFVSTAFVSTAWAASEKAQVLGARTWAHDDYTRFVVEITGSVEYTTFVLADPGRLVIDLPEVEFVIPRSVAAKQRPVGFISAFRYGLFKRGTSRVVLDLNGPVRVMRSFLLPPDGGKPYRLVVDLERTTEEDFAARAVRVPAPQNVAPIVSAGIPDPAAEPDELGNVSTATPPPPPPPLAVLSLPRPAPRPTQRPKRQPSPPKYESRIMTIVIDPGHGGVDPGAIGISGVREKDVALHVAHDIAAQLRALGGYRVILTRENDSFLRLRERLEVGRRFGADLFLSLHADSIGQRSVRGAHVYTLSDKASDAEAAALAAKENKADVIAGVDLANFTPEVGGILLDLAQRETNNVSAGFAERLVSEMRRDSIPLLRKPHRQAGFAVLKAPDVPSVLIELGFLSNPADEKMLVDPDARKSLVRAIVHGVERHFKTQMARNF